MSEWVCHRHNARGIGTICPLCAREIDTRETIAVLETRIGDLSVELPALRRQVNELRGIVQDLQDHISRLAAHIRPDEELLP